MSRIAEVFSSPGRKALIPYATVGYPSVDVTLKVVPMLAACGADIIELGIPFSDPLADGVTIQRASFEALENGVTPAVCLDVARQLRRKVSVPLVFMTYFNPVFQHGLARFCRDCGRAGVDGLIVPDLPPEEGTALEEAAQRNGVDVIYLLAPTSTAARVRLVTEHSRGFVYLVSVAGVTGARAALPADLARFVARVRKVADKPLCVGFGIGTAEQAQRVAKIADGVIVGSRLIQAIEEDATLRKARNLIAGMRRALDEV